MARLTVFVVLSLLASPAVADKAPCPPHRAGEAYPWESDALMEGDHWADIAIDLDAHGKVTGCRVVKGNLESDEGFYMCRAYTNQGEFDPVTKDGVAIAGTIQTHTMLKGMRHQDADDSARKRWFTAHPQERQSCYPE